MKVFSRTLPAMIAIALSAVSITGCAQKKEAMPEAVPPKTEQPVAVQPEIVRVKKEQSEGCRTCHGPDATGGAGDFTAIYEEPKSHHPVGVRYPAAEVNSNFVQPPGRYKDVAFFDRNGNGKPDRDEVVLFGASGEATVECASCHWEHGGAHTMERDPARLYLRVENAGSALCVTCHQF